MNNYQQIVLSESSYSPPGYVPGQYMDGTMQGYQAQVSDTQFTDSNMQMSPYSETQRQQ